MKNFLVIFAGCILAASCSEADFMPATESGETSLVTTVQIVNGQIGSESRVIVDSTKNALAFADEKAYEAFIQSLEGKSTAEKTAIVGKYGVKNLHKLAEEADAELEQIGAEATSESEFRTAYEAYVDKYDGLLLTNTSDPSDLDLYVPDGRNIESFIANSDGVYAIGNVVKTAELKRDIAAVMPLQNTTPTVWNDTLHLSLNEYVYKPQKGKKVFFTIARNYDTVRVSMQVKKNMWYGWKNDPKRTMIYQPNFSGAQITWIVPAFTRTWFPSKDPYELDIVNVVGQGALTGTIHTWTDLTAEHDADGNLLYIGTGNNPCPLVTLDKSITVTVNLPRTK